MTISNAINNKDIIIRVIHDIGLAMMCLMSLFDLSNIVLVMICLVVVGLMSIAEIGLTTLGLGMLSDNGVVILGLLAIGLAVNSNLNIVLCPPPADEAQKKFEDQLPTELPRRLNV